MTRDRAASSVGYLHTLAKEGNEDRGALADLRSGLSQEPGEMARVHVFPTRAGVNRCCRDGPER